MHAATLSLTLAVSLTITSVSAAGQTDTSSINDVEEILVTARLRTEAAHDVPFALTALDNSALASRRIDDTHSLFRQVPGLSLTSFDDGRFAYFQLRGIGPLSQAISPDDGSVVTYVDGVPQPVYASEFAYLNLERIEVLRGPQGTLYGRNSQGGALNITTRQPGDSTDAGLRLESGGQGHRLAQGTLSGPINGDSIAGSLVLHTASVDGFIRNIAPNGGRLGGRNTAAGRGSLIFTPSGDQGARFTLTANLDRQESSPFYYVLAEQPEPVVELDPENEVDRRSWGVNLKSETLLGATQLTSITAFNGFDNEQYTDDTDGLIYGPLFGLPSADFLPPLSFSDWQEREQRFYQEIRLSDTGASSTAWTIGTTYFFSDFDVELNNRSSFSPFLNGDRDATQKIRSYAIFAETTTSLLSTRLRGTLGARFSRDEKRLDAQYTGVGFPGTTDYFEEKGAANFNLWTGRAALNYAASDSLNLYASAGRGAKSGGFPRFTLNAAIASVSPSYRESTSWTFETGFKARVADGRGTFNAGVFLNDVTDEQLFVLDFVNFQFLPVNLDTRSYGLETELVYTLSSYWTLAGGLSWADGEIRETDTFSGASRGNAIPNTARLSSSLTLDFRGPAWSVGTMALQPSLTLTHQYVDTRAADVANSFYLPSYHNIDVRAGVDYRRMELYLFARNLGDTTQIINGVQYGPGVNGVAMGRGRIAGLGFTGSF